MNSTQYQREQMSISSITSSQTLPLSASSKRMALEPALHLPTDPYPRHHYHRMKHSRSHPGNMSMDIHHMIRSPPASPEQDQYIHSPPSSPSSFDTAAQHCQYQDGPVTHSLQERRQRNKAASAKYRQKKNMQQHEMRTMIQEISERNAVLERQLKEIQEENQKLRATADKLRGKFVAKKLLRQWMDRHSTDKQHYSSPPHELINEVNDDDLDSLCSDL